MQTINRDTKTTNAALSASERGNAAGWADISLDWNEQTGEWNPYPIGSPDFNEYERAYSAALEACRAAFPDA